MGTSNQISKKWDTGCPSFWVVRGTLWASLGSLKALSHWCEDAPNPHPDPRPPPPYTLDPEPYKSIHRQPHTRHPTTHTLQDVARGVISKHNDGT